MAVISEVKCGRCDRRYSGFRSRCPYCGARRNKRGKHADEGENAKAKLIIGISLLVLLIAATMILILTSIPEDSPEVSTPSESPVVTDTAPVIPDDTDVTHVEDPTEPTEPVTPTTPEVPVIEVAEVIVTYTGKAIPENDFTMKLGEILPLGFKTIPDTADKTAVWASSDENVFMVTSDGKVTATGRGSATVTVTIDGVVGKCTVRVRG